jgi:hypothetical protein
MKNEFYTNKASLRSNRRRNSKRVGRPSISIESLHKSLDDLHAEGVRGEYQAQLRLETISQLLDPCLNYCESDVHRILSKGYPPQVERGLTLYRLMSRLTILCEPVGDAVGVACRVRLIKFEDLTWSQFLNLKSNTHTLISRMSGKGTTADSFNALELLKPEEKDLYERVKLYFGGRKRPTLKSLALGLLAEEGEVFTDRGASNQLAAARDFRDRHKDKLGFKWSFVGGVDHYNRSPKSAREFYAEGISSIGRAVSGFIVPNYSMNIGEAIFGMHKQMAGSHMWIQEFAKCLPKISEQAELAKFAAHAISGLMRMPQFPLPEAIFDMRVPQFPLPKTVF